MLIVLTLLGCTGDDPTRCEPVLSADGATVTLDAGDCGGAELTAEVPADVELELRVDGPVLTPVLTATADTTFTHLHLAGDVTLQGEETPRWWRQGYQSWSWSGVLELEPVERDEAGLPRVGGDGDAWSVAGETPYTSWWVGLLGRPDGASVLAGALSASTTKVWLAAEEDRLEVVWGGRGESIHLAAGESLALDPVRLDVGTDAFALYEAYGRASAELLDVPPLPDELPVGWATWYQLYEDVTEDDVRANLAEVQALAADPELAPLDLFQLDDGWQEGWGVWTADAGFPSGMDALADDIAAAGLTPGLWMAPFYVDTASETYAEHPDWFVHTEDGGVLRFTNLGASPVAVIDATHPEAAAWMGQQVADRVAEGWTYLKLDFLYAGAQEGVRHEDVTGVQAYHRGMAVLREAAGDSWVLACGAPMLPSVGYAQSYRSGADIAFTIDRDPRREYLRWQVRSTAARSWQGGVWWWLDPDQILVREPFSVEEARGAVVANAVSGGVWILGDDLPALDAERLAVALDPEAAALRGVRFRPVDPLDYASGFDPGPTGELASPDDRVPVRWVGEDGTVALLNLSDEEVSVQGPGGEELLTGETGAGMHALAPGVGELWRTDGDTDEPEDVE